jgi:hypothetical protein
MSAISGVSWEEAWRDRAAGRCGSHDVWFLGRDTFIRTTARRDAKGSGRYRRDLTSPGTIGMRKMERRINSAMR